ncbi:MAG: FAD-binding protein, partial [Bacteroidetes bacterium]|nr:FAD-binding protein [Bacteroidota bacterium]
MLQTDFLIIGSGIAGLTFAVKTAKRFPEKRIIILTKANTEESNTKYAQGGIAVVNDWETDSFQKHIEDTLIAGDGLCNQDIVSLVVNEGPARVNEIIEWGTNFDKDASGKFLRGKEGGHSEFRILHHKDFTGYEIERALVAEAQRYPNIAIYNHWFVIDLITQHHLGFLVTKSTPDIECYGVYALNLETGNIEKILAKITLMASGGTGQAYRTTTNPKIATGDGIAMVYRAKGRIENMEFIQFHPTALYESGVSPSF